MTDVTTTQSQDDIYESLIEEGLAIETNYDQVPNINLIDSLIIAITQDVQFDEPYDIDAIIQDEEFTQQASARFVPHELTLTTTACNDLTDKWVETLKLVHNHERHPFNIDTYDPHKTITITQEDLNKHCELEVTINPISCKIHIQRVQPGTKYNDYLLHTGTKHVHQWQSTDMAWVTNTVNSGANWHLDVLNNELHQVTGYKVIAVVDVFDLIDINHNNLLTGKTKYKNFNEYWTILNNIKSFQWGCIGPGTTAIIPCNLAHCTQITILDNAQNIGYYYLTTSQIPALALSLYLFTSNAVGFKLTDEILQSIVDNVVYVLNQPTTVINYDTYKQLVIGMSWVETQLETLETLGIGNKKFSMILINALTDRMYKQPELPAVTEHDSPIKPKSKPKRKTNNSTALKRGNSKTVSNDTTRSTKRIKLQQPLALDNTDEIEISTLAVMDDTIKQEATENVKYKIIENFVNKLQIVKTTTTINDTLVRVDTSNMTAEQLITHVVQLGNELNILEELKFIRYCVRAASINKWMELYHEQHSTRTRGVNIKKAWEQSEAGKYISYTYATCYRNLYSLCQLVPLLPYCSLTDIGLTCSGMLENAHIFKEWLVKHPDRLESINKGLSEGKSISHLIPSLQQLTVEASNIDGTTEPTSSTDSTTELTSSSNPTIIT